MLPTFPYFQLSCCGDLINDLGLSFSSYLDAWIPSSCQWEQQTITVVRIVESQQRLLYKVRRRLTDPLPDSDCLCLHEELQLQAGTLEARARSLQTSGANSSASSSLPSPSKSRPLSMNEPSSSQNKRPLKASTPTADVHESGSSPKTQVMNGYYMPHPSPNIVSGVEDNPSQSNVTGDRQNNDGDDNNMFIFQNMFYSQQPHQGSDNTLPQYLLSPTASAPPIPYITHPPLKRWPNDYTVSEIAEGFTSMDLLIAHNAATGGVTQRQAFERVFGCRYVKSTVCRHRAVWRKANPALKEQYEAMGSDERACWGEFVRRVEGRPGKSGSSSDTMMSPSPTATLGYQSGGEEEDVHGQEGVMTLSQNQGQRSPVLTSNIAIIADMDVNLTVAGPSNPNPVSSSKSLTLSKMYFLGAE